MATGYNIFLPNGSTEIVKASTYQERLGICTRLLDKWSPYCQSNWLSVNYNHRFCPENKVKMFLSSLGYFLIGSGGGENGIVTRYKDIMNGKREIPISFCPSYMQDYVYGMVHTGCQGTQFAKSQDESFNEYMKFLDEKAQRSYKKRPQKKKPHIETRSERIEGLYKSGVRKINELYVNTDGEFQYDGTKYKIDMERCRKYAPKKISQDDVLYDMDTVIRAVFNNGTVRYYDQDYYPLDDIMVIE